MLDMDLRPSQQAPSRLSCIMVASLATDRQGRHSNTASSTAAQWQCSPARSIRGLHYMQKSDVTGHHIAHPALVCWSMVSVELLLSRYCAVTPDCMVRSTSGGSPYLGSPSYIVHQPHHVGRELRRGVLPTVFGLSSLNPETEASLTNRQNLTNMSGKYFGLTSCCKGGRHGTAPLRTATLISLLQILFICRDGELACSLAIVQVKRTVSRHRHNRNLVEES